MKNSVLTLLISAFTLCAVGCSVSDTESETPSSHFPEDIAAARSAVRNIFEKDHKDYPDFYAGNYISADKEWLVVQFTTDDTSEYDHLLEEHSCIKFNKVQYSLDELWEMYFEFDESNYYEKLPEIGFSASVSEEYNCLEITVYPDSYTQDNISTLESVLHDFPIRITKQSGNIVLL